MSSPAPATTASASTMPRSPAKSSCSAVGVLKSMTSSNAVMALLALPPPPPPPRRCLSRCSKRSSIALSRSLSAADPDATLGVISERKPFNAMRGCEADSNARIIAP